MDSVNFNTITIPRDTGWIVANGPIFEIGKFTSRCADEAGVDGRIRPEAMTLTISCESGTPAHTNSQSRWKLEAGTGL